MNESWTPETSGLLELCRIEEVGETAGVVTETAGVVTETAGVVAE